MYLVCTYVHVSLCTHAEATGGYQGPTSTVLRLISMRLTQLGEHSFGYTGWPLSSQAPGVSASNAGVEGMYIHIKDCCMLTGDSNSGPHVCTTNILSTDPSPQTS